MKITLKQLNNTVFEFIHGEIYNLGFGPTMAPVVTSDYRFNELEALFESSDGDMYKPKPTVLCTAEYCMSVEHLESKPITVAFCGSFSPFDRGLVKAQASENGMIVRGGVSIKTDLLVTGERCGSKVDKARKLNIPTITVENFITNQLGFTDEQAQKELTTESVHQRISENCNLLKPQYSRGTEVFITLGENDIKQQINQPSEELNSYFNDEIEAFAEELFNIQHNAVDGSRHVTWSTISEISKNGYRAMANHVSTPKTDIQQSLVDTLNSERELMGVLREIGKLFNVSVGVNIGLNDLPEHISKCMSSLRSQSNAISTCAKLLSVINKVSTETSLKNYTEFRNGVIEALDIKPQLRNDINDVELVNILKLTIEEEHLILRIKNHPQLHDLITHLHDFKSAIEVREVISRTCQDDNDKTYWTRQLNTVNKLIELTEPTVIK